MNEQFYMVVDGKSVGPFSLDDLIKNSSLKEETLVWKPGLSEWIQAKNLPELEAVFIKAEDPIIQEPFINSVPPINTEPKQPQPNFADNPQYKTDHIYDNGFQRPNPYNNPYQRPQQTNYGDYYQRRSHTNWLGWAIVATVLGALTSCFGLIFGVIGIVQANKANRFYSQGYEREGDVANSSAKIMTIIGLVIAGLAIIGLLVYFSMLGSIVGIISDLPSYSV